MGYERRGIDPGPPNGSAQLAENDAHFTEYVYNDTTGLLLFGEPVYKDMTDAGEFNSSNNAYASLLTYQTSGSNTVRTGGRIVTGTNANAGSAGNEVCVGIYQPLNPAESPVIGQVIRVLDRGCGVISAQSPAAGSAGVVGGTLISSVAVRDAVPGARSSGLNIGVLLATRTFVAVGSQIFAAASAARTLCNAFIALA